MCPTPITIKDPSSEGKQMMSVPCGKCGACRKNRRADWTFRLKEELRASINAHFITLTYDEENLPETLDRETGEVLPTLRRRHFTLFIKRLRKDHSKFTENQLRYYAVGEYGTKTNRPHYHVIFFNCPNRIIAVLDRYWKAGLFHVGTVEPASIHYVTKYHVNYQTETDDERENEFATMSRNPGIGYKYLERADTWHLENGNIYVVNNGFKQRMPKYYRDKIFSEDQRRGQSIVREAEQIKRYEREFERLAGLGIEDPDRYMFTSGIIHSKKVKHKANQNDTF